MSSCITITISFLHLFLYANEMEQHMFQLIRNCKMRYYFIHIKGLLDCLHIAGAMWIITTSALLVMQMILLWYPPGVRCTSYDYICKIMPKVHVCIWLNPSKSKPRCFVTISSVAPKLKLCDKIMLLITIYILASSFTITLMEEFGWNDIRLV